MRYQLLLQRGFLSHTVYASIFLKIAMTHAKIQTKIHNKNLMGTMTNYETFLNFKFLRFQVVPNKINDLFLSLIMQSIFFFKFIKSILLWLRHYFKLLI